MSDAKIPTKVVTGKVRFCFVHVFEPSSMNEDEDKKYSVMALVPKKDKVTVGKLEAAVEAAKEQGKGSKFGGKIPSNLKLPLRDGDMEYPDREEFKGMLFFNANSAQKPGVVDENVNPIIDKDEFYSGCYGRVSVNFFPFAGKSKGVAAGLNNVQKLDDGEKLSGGSSAAEDFGSDNEDDDLL